jgi:TRAP-type C4-dicarboxylate transport system permease small subunit
VNLDRAELALRTALGVAVSLLLAAMVAICLAEVVLRDVFAGSFSWYDETVGYLLVWLTFLGAVLAQSHDQHIGIGDLVERAPPRLRRTLELTGHLVLAGVHVVLLVYGWQLAARFLGERAITVPVPMGVVYAVIPLSAALMLLVETACIARLVRTA